MQIGPYTLSSLHVQSFALDGGAMFGVVPKLFWQEASPADERNRVDLSTNLLLISGNGRNILVDAGMGSAWPPKMQEIYKVSRFSIQEELARVGLALEAITDIILTHLHFDHIAGAFRRNGDELEPIFPHAVFHVQEENLRTARTPNRKERASYNGEFVEAFSRLCTINPVTGPGELLAGIELLVSHGHTRGQQLVKVSSGEQSLVHCGDLVPSAAHIPLPWTTAYDIDPLRVIEEKEALLESAVEGGWSLYFGHDPRIDGATLRRDSKGIVFDTPLKL